MSAEGAIHASCREARPRRGTGPCAALLLVLFGGGGAPLFAQASTPTPCEQAEHRRDFDFWVGDWNVYLPDGTLAGTNSIVAVDGGCTLLERWTSRRGATGTSVNIYHPGAELWQQLWMGADGGVIEISGGLRGISMVLEGALTSATGAMQPFRGTWTPNPDGSVRQHFEVSSDGGATWETWFDGRYVRRA